MILYHDVIPHYLFGVPNTSYSIGDCLSIIAVTSIAYVGALDDSSTESTEVIIELIDVLLKFVATSVFVVDQKSSYFKRLVYFVSQLSLPDNNDWKKTLFVNVKKTDPTLALTIFDFSKETDRNMYKECIYAIINEEGSFS
jgi:hypothetical protein